MTGWKLDGQMVDGILNLLVMGDSGSGPKYLGQMGSHIRYWRESIRKCTPESITNWHHTDLRSWLSDLGAWTELTSSSENDNDMTLISVRML